MLTDWTFTDSVPVIVTGVPPSGEPVTGAGATEGRAAHPSTHIPHGGIHVS